MPLPSTSRENSGATATRKSYFLPYHAAISPISVVDSYARQFTCDYHKSRICRILGITILKVLNRETIVASVLILDDEDLMREAIRMALEEDAYEIQEAENGLVGLELCRKNPVDVVITDLIMPVKDGIETIRDLRREFPDIKIIALSGRGGTSMTANLQRALRTGADLTIAKPCEPHEIREAVRKVLAGEAHYGDQSDDDSV